MSDNRQIIKNPGLVQANQRWGLYKGFVVDTADVEQRARVRVHLYGLDADYNDDLSTDLMYWAEPVLPIVGSFSPPEMGSRVWVMFEAGDMENPVYLGFGYANPVGRGTLPCDSGYGSEAPNESWGNSHNGYPENLTLFKTGEGSVFYANNKLLNNQSMETEIVVEDTGGKGIQVRSYHQNQPDNTPTLAGSTPGLASIMDQAPEFLDGVQVTKGNVTRTGWPGEFDDAPGEIVVQVPDLALELSRSDSYSSLDVFQVESGGTDFGYEQHVVSGLMDSERVGQALETGFSDTWFLNSPKYIMINGSLQPPRRWAR